MTEEHQHRWKVPNPVSTRRQAEVYVHCLDCGKVGVVRISTQEPISELERAQLQEMKDIYQRRFGVRRLYQEVEIARRIADHGKNYKPGLLERIEDWMDKHWPWRH